nr:site-specific integrase [uncultured Chitinophaga sp.]
MQYRPARIYPFDSLKAEQDDLFAAGKITQEQYFQNVALIPQKALAVSKWYVFYFYMHPFSGKYERFKVYEDINLFRGEEKIQYAKDLRDATTIALKNGYSPWDEEEKLDVFLAESEKHAAARAAGDLSNASMIYGLHLFLTAKKEAGKSDSTISAYTTTANFVRNWLNENGMLLTPAANLTGPQLLQILKEEAIKNPEEKWENKTYNNYLLYLETILNWLAKDINGKIIPHNPIKGAEQREVTTNRPSAYTDEELEAVLKAVRDAGDIYVEGLILTSYYAAIRSKAEMRGFKIENIRWDRDLLLLGADATKARREDYVPLDPILKEFFIKNGFDKLPGEWYVFSNNRGPGPIQAAENFYARLYRPFRDTCFIDLPAAWIAYAEGRETGYIQTLKNLYAPIYSPYGRCGIDEDKGLYKFKHTRAIHLALAKKSPYAIMELFRHTSLDQTMIYLRDLGLTVNYEAVEDSRSI